MVANPEITSIPLFRKVTTVLSPKSIFSDKLHPTTHTRLSVINFLTSSKLPSVKNLQQLAGSYKQKTIYKVQ